MATTPNYGWVTPAPTDFVTDLPADFETFADAVDADLAGLLGGTTGQVLTKDSNTDHDFSWQTAATPSVSPNWALLNTGGTSLTAADTITVSGISGKNQLLVTIRGASMVNGSAQLRIRFNADSGNNYNAFGTVVSYPTSYSKDNLNQVNSASGSSIALGNIGDTENGNITGYLLVQGGNSSNLKTFIGHAGGPALSGGQNASTRNVAGFWNNASTISSVSIISSNGNFDEGTVFIYGSDN